MTECNRIGHFPPSVPYAISPISFCMWCRSNSNFLHIGKGLGNVAWIFWAILWWNMILTRSAVFILLLKYLYSHCYAASLKCVLGWKRNSKFRKSFSIHYFSFKYRMNELKFFSINRRKLFNNNISSRQLHIILVSAL